VKTNAKLTIEKLFENCSVEDVTVQWGYLVDKFRKKNGNKTLVILLGHQQKSQVFSSHIGTYIKGCLSWNITSNKERKL
jgi:hypothetical protein